MQGIEFAECIAKPINLAVAQAIGSIELQVLGHPHLVADGCVLVHLPVTGIGKGSTVLFSVDVHTVCRANRRRIEGVNGFFWSGGTIVAGAK